jgi:hypothetical protein
LRRSGYTCATRKLDCGKEMRFFGDFSPCESVCVAQEVYEPAWSALSRNVSSREDTVWDDAFRLVRRHILPQVLSRVRSNGAGPINQAPHVSPMPERPWRRDGVLGPEQEFVFFNFTITGIIRLITVITAAVPIRAGYTGRNCPSHCATRSGPLQRATQPPELRRRSSRADDY